MLTQQQHSFSLFSQHELTNLEKTISAMFERPDDFSPAEIWEALSLCLRSLELGKLRIASPPEQSPSFDPETPLVSLDSWIVHPWVKKVILLTLRLRQTSLFSLPQSEQLQGEMNFLKAARVHGNALFSHDKLDIQTTSLADSQVRAVQGSIVREGACVRPGVILMPSFVNIGAYVGKGTMVDTWATVGSCAQIGRNVHLAGGVGVGGVLEPENARPVLVGDNAFLGSRVIVVEGVVVGEGAILGANVCLTSSTPLYDVTTPEKREYRGYVPPGAVVAPGTRMRTFPGGEIPLQCAYIIAWRNPATDAKVSLNDALRETGIPV